MSLATITFWSENCNVYGIPDVLHSYLVSITSNQAAGKNNKILRIIPITENAPKPIQGGPFILRNATVDEALSKSFNILSEVEELEGLRGNKNIIKSEGKKLQFISY